MSAGACGDNKMVFLFNITVEKNSILEIKKRVVRCENTIGALESARISSPKALLTTSRTFESIGAVARNGSSVERETRTLDAPGSTTTADTWFHYAIPD